MGAGLVKTNLGGSRARDSRASPPTRRIRTYTSMLVCIRGNVGDEFLGSKGKKAFPLKK